MYVHLQLQLLAMYTYMCNYSSINYVYSFELRITYVVPLTTYAYKQLYDLNTDAPSQLPSSILITIRSYVRNCLLCSAMHVTIPSSSRELTLKLFATVAASCDML